MGSKVLVEIREAVQWITVNRPERRNALDIETTDAIREAVVKGGRNPTVRVQVITGAGGAFSAGADLKANAEVRGEQDLIEHFYNPMIRAVRRSRKPVVAAVDGVATGIGGSLALACDIRLASERARFAFLFVKRGLGLDGGASWFLPRLVGLRAYEIGLAGEMIDAREAERIGLVNRVLPEEGFAEAVQKYAVGLAANAPVAMAKIKQSITDALGAGLDDTLEAERLHQQDLFRTEDFAEGVAAFLAKREPVYKGR
jgi:2-(1,2-epoxy-1,2-dihydrophenyl)acetyl-CoA isomerase